MLAKQVLYHWSRSTTGATLPALFALIIFQIGSLVFAWASLNNDPPGDGIYRCAPSPPFFASFETGSGSGSLYIIQADPRLTIWYRQYSLASCLSLRSARVTDVY
jgi:hypothetical protein